LLNVPVFHADLEARFLQNNDLHIKSFIVERFGEQLYTPDGILDREKMAWIIFNDPEALASINEIIHPAVRQKFLKWCEGYEDAPYILYEAAILFESGYNSDFDRNILILADEKVRIERVISRDHTSEELVRQRISNQMPDIDKIKMADYIIENNDKSILFPQIIKLDKLFREDGEIW
jgi:dephospho-CoA kinase